MSDAKAEIPKGSYAAGERVKVPAGAEPPFTVFINGVEQSEGVRQVGAAVTQMDQGTQQNAALVEQSAAAAESLRQQSQQLVQAVAVFRV